MNFIETLNQNWGTALLFWTFFAISIILAHFYQYIFNNFDTIHGKQSLIIKWFFLSIVILGPAIIIGVRRYDVGADTLNNWTAYINLGVVNSIKISFLNTGIDKPLFFLIHYVIYLVFKGTPTVFFTIISFLTLFILALALDKWKDKLSISFALFVYYSFFGMQLLNQSRQMLALSILFYALFFLSEKKVLKYILIVCIAGMIHFTAFVGILFMVFDFKRTKHYLGKTYLFYFILFGSTFFLESILKIASNIIPNKYSAYINLYSSSDIGLGLALNVLPILVPILFFKSYIDASNHQYLKRITFLTLPFRLAGYISYFIMRMYYYGAIPIVILFPMIIRNTQTKKSKFLIFVFFVILCFVYYIVNYMYVNSAYLFPYHSAFN
ncbi:EpsG family protein [Paenibacillus sp. FSL R10-2736]|uniref:EpsG family protein n=1 Tax=Paenibacillus sp. FSL R10-2736 TaxID=2954692 RepID=UPI0030F84162